MGTWNQDIAINTLWYNSTSGENPTQASGGSVPANPVNGAVAVNTGDGKMWVRVIGGGLGSGTNLWEEVAGGGGGGGDITGVTLAGDSGTAEDLTANVNLTIAGGINVTTAASGTTLTIDASTNAATVTVVDSTDATSFIAMFDSAAGSLAVKTDASLTYNASNGTLFINGILSMTSARDVGVDSTYGLFKYDTDGGGDTHDVLAFASGQDVAAPEVGTAESSFWIMSSESISGGGSYLFFEPVVSYSGVTNNAWIGYHNRLAGIRSYYVRIGDGTESYPSFSFVLDATTGFRRSVASPARFTAVTDGDDVASFDDSSGLVIHKINSGGGNVDLHIVSSTGAVIKNTSSKRFKNNIADLNFDSNILYQLRPVSFDWKDGHVYENRHDFGLIAEEVDELIPEMVGHDTDGQASAVNYAKLSVLLLEEVKKLRKEIDEIKEKI